MVKMVVMDQQDFYSLDCNGRHQKSFGRSCSCSQLSAIVSDGTANQLTYNWRKDGEVFATDSGAGGASLITTTESGTYDVLISHSREIRSNKYH